MYEGVYLYTGLTETPSPPFSSLFIGRYTYCKVNLVGIVYSYRDIELGINSGEKVWNWLGNGFSWFHFTVVSVTVAILRQWGGGIEIVGVLEM